MLNPQAHKFDAVERSEDVHTHEDLLFEGLMLNKETLEGLKLAGFEKVSPIQKVAIPSGKFGFDLVVQAKSGTGKTCVFTVIAMEMLSLPSKSLQVLVLAPTREVAMQISEVMVAIGAGHKGLKVGLFIGGLPIEEDARKIRGCHIAVGTPGRIKHLIVERVMDTSRVRLVVLDEADHLVWGGFADSIKFIMDSLPPKKQIIAVSATYYDDVKEFLDWYMRSPMHVCPEELKEAPTTRVGQSPCHPTVLLGVRQCVGLVPQHASAMARAQRKLDALVHVLSNVSFKQCIVFNNSIGNVEHACQILRTKGWSTEFISGIMDQQDRIDAVAKLSDFRIRVLLSTDLTARGLDAANVNLVVNMDIPMSEATYLHRVGRAGRFGTKGLVITLCEKKGVELVRLRKIATLIGVNMKYLSIDPSIPLKQNLWTCELPSLNDEHLGETDNKGIEKNFATKPAVKDCELEGNPVDNINSLEISKKSDLKEAIEQTKEAEKCPLFKEILVPIGQTLPESAAIGMDSFPCVNGDLEKNNSFLEEHPFSTVKISSDLDLEPSCGISNFAVIETVSNISSNLERWSSVEKLLVPLDIKTTSEPDAVATPKSLEGATDSQKVLESTSELSSRSTIEPMLEGSCEEKSKTLVCTEAAHKTQLPVLSYDELEKELLNFDPKCAFLGDSSLETEAGVIVYQLLDIVDKENQNLIDDLREKLNHLTFKPFLQSYASLETEKEQVSKDDTTPKKGSTKEKAKLKQRAIPKEQDVGNVERETVSFDELCIKPETLTSEQLDVLLSKSASSSGTEESRESKILKRNLMIQRIGSVISLNHRPNQSRKAADMLEAEASKIYQDEKEKVHAELDSGANLSPKADYLFNMDGETISLHSTHERQYHLLDLQDDDFDQYLNESPPRPNIESYEAHSGFLKPLHFNPDVEKSEKMVNFDDSSSHSSSSFAISHAKMRNGYQNRSSNPKAPASEAQNSIYLTKREHKTSNVLYSGQNEDGNAGEDQGLVHGEHPNDLAIDFDELQLPKATIQQMCPERPQDFLHKMKIKCSKASHSGLSERPNVLAHPVYATFMNQYEYPAHLLNPMNSHLSFEEWQYQLQKYTSFILDMEYNRIMKKNEISEFHH